MAGFLVDKSKNSELIINLDNLARQRVAMQYHKLRAESVSELNAELVNDGKVRPVSPARAFDITWFCWMLLYLSISEFWKLSVAPSGCLFTLFYDVLYVNYSRHFATARAVHGQRIIGQRGSEAGLLGPNKSRLDRPWP